MSLRLLVLGGRRSGKSRYAHERAQAAAGNAVVFIATARPGDPELDARIAAHRAHRPASWVTIEVDADLAGAIARADPARLLLVDSLTLWVSTVVEAEGSVRPRWKATAEVLAERRGGVVFVSEEAGLGIVPMSPLTRQFLDELGWLNQQLASSCDEVRFMVAGIPSVLKGAS